MIDELITLLQFCCTLAAGWALMCRMSMMSRITEPRVRRQHATLFAGLVMSLVLPGHFGTTSLVIGVLGFLLFSTNRWRFGQPSGVTRPAPLEDENLLKQISGGRRDA